MVLSLLRQQEAMQYQFEGQRSLVLSRVVTSSRSWTLLAATHTLLSRFWFFLGLVLGVLASTGFDLEIVDLVLLALVLLLGNEVFLFTVVVAAKLSCEYSDTVLVLESEVLFAVVVESAFCHAIMLDGAGLERHGR